MLIVILAVSAMSKLSRPNGLRDLSTSLEATRLVRHDVALPTAVGLAAAEAALVVLLILPRTMTTGLTGAALLLSVLTVGVFAVVHRGTVAPCRCFGASGVALSTRHVVRNGLLCAVAVAGLLSPSEPLPLAGRLTAILTGAALSLPFVLMDDVVDLWAPARRP